MYYLLTFWLPETCRNFTDEVTVLPTTENMEERSASNNSGASEQSSKVLVVCFPHWMWQILCMNLMLFLLIRYLCIYFYIHCYFLLQKNKFNEKWIRALLYFIIWFVRNICIIKRLMPSVIRTILLYFFLIFCNWITISS